MRVLKRQEEERRKVVTAQSMLGIQAMLMVS